MKLLQRIIINSNFFSRIKGEVGELTTLNCNDKEYTVVCLLRDSSTTKLSYIDICYIDERIHKVITARCHKCFGDDKYDITVRYKDKWFALICEMIRYYDIYNYSYVLSVSEPLYSLKRDGYQLYPYSIQVSNTVMLDPYAISAEKRVDLANENGFCFKDIDIMDMSLRMLAVYNGAIVYYGKRDTNHNECAIFTMDIGVYHDILWADYKQRNEGESKKIKDYVNWLYAIATFREDLGTRRFKATKSARN